MSTRDELTHKVGGQALVERILVVCSYLTGGLSELAMHPVKQLLDRQIKQLQEVLIEEMRAGDVPEGAVIDEEHLVAFVLRISRAAHEGAARRKLKIMARYFFRNATSPAYSPDAAGEFFDITAQLTDMDMRCLAVVKRATEMELFEEGTNQGSRTISFEADLPIEGLFDSKESFKIGAMALFRFGFVYIGSTWGGIVGSLTSRALDYVESIDLDCVDPLFR
jgi:hypothetical protein